jgi:hypothetical protein
MRTNKAKEMKRRTSQRRATHKAPWQELKKDGPADAVSARRKLARTIVALAAVGETDPMKLKRFALHATLSTPKKINGLTVS